MTRKKEYLIVFILFFAFIFAFLAVTGTITSGWHLVDDHEYVEYVLQMKAPDGSLFSCMKNVLRADFTSRFRPLYYILRVAFTAVIGSNLVAWSLIKAAETVLALFFLYLCARQFKCSIFQAILFSLTVMVGPQAVVWWKLGPQECTGILFFAAGLYLLNKWLYHEAGLPAKLGSIFFFLCMSLYKESFLVLISFILVYIVYVRCQGQRFSLPGILKAIRSELDLLLILGTIMAAELCIIIFFVGTNNVSYIGLDFSVTLEQYIFMWTDCARTYLQWYVRFTPFLLLLLLLRFRDWRQMIGPCFLGLCIMLPQMALYMKTGLQERYVIPWSFGFAMFFILPLSREIFSGIWRAFYSMLLVLMLICQFQMTIREANYFTYRGQSVTSVLNHVLELVQEDPDIRILAAYSPYLESDITVSYWLMQYGYEDVYSWNEDTKTCTIIEGEKEGTVGDVRDMDVILFYNPQDRHFCYVPDIDMSGYEVTDWGTLTVAERK